MKRNSDDLINVVDSRELVLEDLLAHLIVNRMLLFVEWQSFDWSLFGNAYMD